MKQENIEKEAVLGKIIDKLEEERTNEIRQGPWTELWREKKIRIKNDSPFSHFPSYQLRSIIIKGGDDLRQEV